MAIDIKPENKKSFDLPDSFNVLFYYSIILLLFSISGYLLVSEWNSEIQAQINNREDVLSRLQNKEEFNKNKKTIANYKKSIDDYTRLFWEGRKLDNFFLFLENAIHPLAHLNSINLDTEEGEIILSGSILDFTALEQQHSILKKFYLEKEVAGWIKKDSTKREGDDIELQDNTELFESPITKESREIIKNKNKEEVVILQEIDSDNYSFNELNTEEELVKDEWYEVVIVQRIKPIKEVSLDEISETDNELGVNFTFKIKVDQSIFKQ